MTKTTIIRAVCDRCPEVVEIKAGFLSRYPSGWEKKEGKWMCPKCVAEYQATFSKFLQEGKKKK